MNLISIKYDTVELILNWDGSQMVLLKIRPSEYFVQLHGYLFCQQKLSDQTWWVLLVHHQLYFFTKRLNVWCMKKIEWCLMHKKIECLRTMNKNLDSRFVKRSYISISLHFCESWSHVNIHHWDSFTLKNCYFIARLRSFLKFQSNFILSYCNLKIFYWVILKSFL